MISTPALHQLVSLAEANQWRLVLVGDDRQLQAVGRGGLFAELCANGRVDQLEHLHRFKHDWEAAASLQLRSGDPRALDAYEAHDRIIPGTLDDHLAAIGRNVDRASPLAATPWPSSPPRMIMSTPSTTPSKPPESPPDSSTRTSPQQIAGGECAHVGDVVATRRNDRTLITSAGEPVRNRETWTVTAIGTDGSLTVTREQGHGTVTLARRLRPRPRQVGLRGDRARLPVRHRRPQPLTRLGGDDPPRPVRRRHPRPRRRTCSAWSPTATTSPKPETPSRRSSPSTVPTSPPSPNAAPSPTNNRPRRHAKLPTPTGRCVVPEWFEPLRAGLRRELYDAEQALTASEARRARLAAEATAAQRDLVRIEAATAPARQALAAATPLRGGVAAPRGRRPAATTTPLPRNSKQRPNTSNAPDDTPPQTSSTTTRHARAATARRCIATTCARLNHTVDHVAALRRQVESLDLWGRWAGGDTVNVQQLGDIVEQLTNISRRDEHADQFQTLGQTVRDWAGDAGIDLPTATRHSRTLQRAGPELGL